MALPTTASPLMVRREWDWNVEILKYTHKHTPNLLHMKHLTCLLFPETDSSRVTCSQVFCNFGIRDFFYLENSISFVHEVESTGSKSFKADIPMHTVLCKKREENISVLNKNPRTYLKCQCQYKNVDRELQAQYLCCSYMFTWWNLYKILSTSSY